MGNDKSDGSDSGGFGAWIRRNWVLSTAIGALITGSIGVVVSRFGPGILEDITGNPLRFLVREDPEAYTDGHGFALSRPPPTTDLPPASSCQEVRRWAMRQGAIDAGRTHLQISIEGLNSSPVLIQSMRARVETREEPLKDTGVRCLTEGEVGVIGVGFNLDERPSLARTLTEDGELGGPFFGTSNITVAKGEVLPLAVTAFTEECFCEWTIEVDAVVEGERQLFVLDDNGDPFQTTAMLNLPQHQVLWYGGEWAVCHGLVTCFPGTKPSPLSSDGLEYYRDNPVVSVVP